LASWTTPEGRTIEVMVKIPVGPAEHRWTVRLGSIDPDRWDDGEGLPTPRILAAGTSLGQYDLGWLIVERLAGRPIAAEKSKRAVQDLLSVAADFQAAAVRACPEIGPAPETDWDRLLDSARRSATDNDLPESQRWRNQIRKVHRALPALLERWNARPLDTWCHGDLHLGNAMRRRSGTGREPGACVLIDLALVHPGHWVEDAVYLERIYWGHPDGLHGIKPVAALARARRELGLGGSGDHAALANIRRVLTAACAPAFLAREGNPAYMAAALGIIERILPQVA